MNLGINSIFKKLLSKKRAFTLDGVKRVIKQVWYNFPPGLHIKTTKILRKEDGNYGGKEGLSHEKCFGNFKCDLTIEINF
jgi:hypothetical protein